ncbi:MAG TPA: hypothetical protein VEU51_05085 [Candidatus Acidoferrales bacterium]|nr:hypothetical protein [Candidatus Acidoferrales bacterium]
MRRHSLGRASFALFFSALAIVAVAGRAAAIDFYEIQIYSTDTTPAGHLTLELHSNTVSTATGVDAKSALNPYQVHETLEATYGVWNFLEVGQYLCTAKLNNGHYEYAGARTKVHFRLPFTDEWPIEAGANVELDYMRRAAEENPLPLEMRPILQAGYRRFTLIGNFAFEKPFSGPQTHRGVQFSPSGSLAYDLSKWITPAVEYYGDVGPLQVIPGAQRQQHFIVPAANLHLLPQLELNLGVGIGLTRTSNGLFLKSIVGWTF